MWIPNGNGVHSGSSFTIMQTVLLRPSHVDRLSHESPPAALLYIKYDIKYPKDIKGYTHTPILAGSALSSAQESAGSRPT